MVSPEHKRRAVASVLSEGLCSLRRACRYLGLARSSYFYRGLPKSDYEKALVERIRELSLAHPCYGYRRLRALLVREGWRVSRKKVQRIRRAEGLQAKNFTKKKKPRGSSTVKDVVARHANDVWSWDFIFDTTENGKSVKILSLVDEATRYCIDLHVDRQISSAKILEVLDGACENHGAPRHIRSDNGPEFIAASIRQWVESRQIDTVYIDPGSPWQNPYVESFHNRFRSECLNRNWFINELDAKVTIADWREEYNTVHPHSGLDYLSPADIFFGRAPGSGRASPSLHREPSQTIQQQRQPQQTTPCLTNI